MRQAGSFELFTYWDDLRRGRAAPERADIDPVAIRKVLADTFMLEVDPGRRYPFCLSGTRLNALFATELKGRSFMSLWNGAQRHEIASLLRMVTDGACAVVAGVEAAPEGYDKIECELLLLPLRHHGKTHSRMLGRIAASKQPSWIGLVPVASFDFISMRVLETGDTDTMPFLEKQTADGGDPSFLRYEQRGHLRIYTGNV